MQQPQAAFEQLNLELGLKLGELPFYNYDKEAVKASVYPGNYPSFLGIVARHLYHHEPYGTTDYLNLPYGEVFSACWNLYPHWLWLHYLSTKDFLAPSIDQLYLEPVPKSEYGDKLSPTVIRTTLQASQEAGILWLGHGQWHPTPVVRFDPEEIPMKYSPRLLGLREWLIFRTKHNLPLHRTQEAAFWEKHSETHPVWILERGLDILAIQAGRPSVTLRNWSIPSIPSPFWHQFSQLLESVLQMPASDQLRCAKYALLPPSKADRATDFLLSLTQISKADPLEPHLSWLQD